MLLVHNYSIEVHIQWLGVSSIAKFVITMLRLAPAAFSSCIFFVDSYGALPPKGPFLIITEKCFGKLVVYCSLVVFFVVVSCIMRSWEYILCSQKISYLDLISNLDTTVANKKGKINNDETDCVLVWNSYE